MLPIAAIPLDSRPPSKEVVLVEDQPTVPHRLDLAERKVEHEKKKQEDRKGKRRKEEEVSSPNPFENLFSARRGLMPLRS